MAKKAIKVLGMYVKDEDSPRYKLNKKDALKILKGAGIAVGGSLAAWALQLLPQVDWGQYGYIVIPVGGILLNAVIKALKSK